ncbi:hypothetical protein [Nocardioides zhouii]|uniref:Uncharacterized protein n=1 Tax=Nocardioides zhouii TaxID=1168729 RepID=A0A4V1RNY6_9ACTN|nr:hypothetical protein [Nocardioides zhouii]RYC07487.1 hypothetical protein EUA94_14455 [Nocardioides zhouii]
MPIISELGRILRVAATTLLMAWLVGNLLVTAVGIVRSHLVAADVAPVLERVLPGAVQAQDELVVTAGRDADREWIEQVCSFTADESGWMAIRHRETCVLRWSFRGCVMLGSVGDVGVVESPEATYVDSRGPAGDPFCTYFLNDPDGTRELAGQRRAIGSGRWLVVVAEQPLVDVAIGCARWTVVFCDNPWIRHALVDRPVD